MRNRLRACDRGGVTRDGCNALPEGDPLASRNVRASHHTILFEHRMAPRLILLGIVLSASALALSAQSPRARFAQGSLGVGSSSGDRYANTAEVAIEVLVARRVGATRTGGVLLGGAIGGAAGPLPHGDVCEMLPDGGCKQPAPQFASVSALVGIESRGTASTVALMAGPSIFVGSSVVRVGAILRADLVSPHEGRAAFVLTPRLLVVPNVDGATLVSRSLSLGLRVR